MRSIFTTAYIKIRQEYRFETVFQSLPFLGVVIYFIIFLLIRKQQSMITNPLLNLNQELFMFL